MHQDWMVLRVEEDLEGVGDTLEGNRDGLGFMCRDWDLEVLNMVFFHEGDVFGWVVLGNEGANLADR